MSYTAIAVIQYSGKNNLVRLFDFDNTQTVDMSAVDICRCILSGGKISNLDLTKKALEKFRFNNEIKLEDLNWKHGSIERYPRFDALTGEIKNKDVAIVLNQSGTDKNKKYTVMFYTGQTAVVPEGKLVQYGERYGLANCKIVSKGGIKYISALADTIPTVEETSKFRLDRLHRVLYIQIPLNQGDTFEIPDYLEGIPVENVKAINITPATAIKNITTLIIPKYMHDITRDILRQFINLKHLVIKSNAAVIYSRAFTSNVFLEHIEVGGVNALGDELCEDLFRLKRFKAHKPLSFIPKRAFKGCTSLDISSVLTDGVQAIKEGAFDGANIGEELTIPSTINAVYRTSFRNTSGLKDIYWKPEIVEIWGATTTSQNPKGLFADCGGPTLHKTATSVIKPNVIDSSVKIVDDLTSDDDRLKLNKAAVKAKMLGMNIVTDAVITTENELKWALAVMDEKELKNVVLSLLNDMLQYGNKRGSKIVNVGPYKFILGIAFNFSIKNALGIKEAKNYFAIVTNRRFELIPYTRKSLIEHCVKPVRSYSYGSAKAVYIEALSVDREKLKALDIEDNNTVRLIYGSDSIGYRTEECNKFKV